MVDCLVAEGPGVLRDATQSVYVHDDPQRFCECNGYPPMYSNIFGLCPSFDEIRETLHRFPRPRLYVQRDDQQANGFDDPPARAVQYMMMVMSPCRPFLSVAARLHETATLLSYNMSMIRCAKFGKHRMAGGQDRFQQGRGAGQLSEAEARPRALSHSRTGETRRTTSRLVCIYLALPAFFFYAAFRPNMDGV